MPLIFALTLPAAPVNLFRRTIAQALMKALPIVEPEISLQPVTRLLHRLITVEINLFVFHRSPQPFHKNVVKGSASPIHADPDPRALKRTHKFLAGKLHPLIGIENLRLGTTQRVL